MPGETFVGIILQAYESVQRDLGVQKRSRESWTREGDLEATE